MITAYGLCVGVLIDNLGVRRSLILGASLLLVSRVSAMLTTSIGLMYLNLFFLMPLGTALGIPVLTTAIRRYTTAENRAVAFGLFYAAMNVAALLSGPAADLLRGAFACGATLGGVHLSAYRLLIASSVVTTLGMLGIAALGVREIEVAGGPAGGTVAFEPRRGSPWRIAREIGRTARFWRFLLLVVLLVAVRLIFRHLDATLPKYLLRTHGEAVPYGLIYAINPALIIVLVPLVSAYTRHVPPLTMIKWGAAVAAASPFCLALSSSVGAAVGFVVLLSIGEACYSPRFYEYATMAAPKGREGTYMALSSAPLFVAKLLAGGMSGVLLEEFCPAAPCDGGRLLWLIIGGVTAVSPVLLFACSSCITGGRDRRQAEDDDVELTRPAA
jgi:POT family proton-dependent oligopeptide transporter